MQNRLIQLPPGDLIDLWDLSRKIALSLCPNLKAATNHGWIKMKREIRSDSMFEAESEMTTLERELLLRLVPNLPSGPELSEEQRRASIEAFLSHPDRPEWKPVFVSPEDVTANGFEILRIQEKHLRALQQEIDSGEMRAFDRHHVVSARAGMKVFIHRADALRYLQQHCFRTTDDTVEPQIGFPTKARGNGASQKVVMRQSLLKEGAVDKARMPANPSGARNDECNDSPTLAHTPATGDDQKTIGAIAPSAATKTTIKRIEALPAKGEIIRAQVSILRRKQVEERTALSRSAIYDKLDPRSPRHDPTFPKQVNLGSSSVGWIAMEIDAWLLSRKRVAR